MRSTAPGQHRPVLLEKVLDILNPQPGEIVVDCTVGWAGHALELLKRVGSTGLLIGLDLDADNLGRAKERLETVGHPFHLQQANFAGLDRVLASHNISAADMVLADLGMSSMQVDDAERGFSYRRDGYLDMRMDRTRGRSVAQVLESISEEELRRALVELGDETAAPAIAKAIVRAQKKSPILRTVQLAEIVQEATGHASWQLHPQRGTWQSHPAAKTFQALRILVNRELANLASLLRTLPGCLRAGGRAAFISFHSGEDRFVKSALREGKNSSIYEECTKDPIRPSFAERQANPRSRSAKLRWARRAGSVASVH